MYSINVDPYVYKFSVTTLYPPKNINNPNYFIIDGDNPLKYYIDPIYRTLEVDNIYIPISKFKISEMYEDQITHEQHDNSNIFYFQFLIGDYLENENENNGDFLGF